MVLGACVPFALADAFCGAAAKPTGGGGCARKTCGAHEALDVDHGLCLPEVAAARMLMHDAPRDEDPKRHASCFYGALVSRAGQLACDVGPLACGGGERYAKNAPDAGVDASADAPMADVAGRCEATPTCVAGEIFDEHAARCERVVRRGVVDVGTWARLAVGVDGGEGSNALCAPVRATGGRGAFQIQIDVPDNDVTRATLELTARPGTPPQSADAAVRALERITGTFHFLAGIGATSANAASISLDVSCSLPQPGRPTLDLAQDSLDAGR